MAVVSAPAYEEGTGASADASPSPARAASAARRKRRKYRWLDLRDAAVWAFAACVMAMIALGRAVEPGSQGGPMLTLFYMAAFGTVAWLVASVLFHWFDRVSDGPSDDMTEGVSDGRMATVRDSEAAASLASQSASQPSSPASSASAGNASPAESQSSSAPAAAPRVPAHAVPAHAAHHAASPQSSNAHSLYAYWMTPTEPDTFGHVLRRDGWRWFVAIIACWLPWVLICLPGVVRDDTIAQFMQSSGNFPYYSQHPLFDTLVFGLFWRAGEALGGLKVGMSLYVAAQMLAFAAGVAIVLCFLRKRGAARSVLLATLLFFGFAPGIAGAVPTMAKDSIHAVFLLPLAVLFAEACLTRGRVLERIPFCVALVALIALAALSKRTSTMAIAVAFLVLIVMAKGWGRRLIAAVCLVLALVLAQGVVEPALEQATHAQISPSKEVMADVLQPIARVQRLHPERITPQEREALAGATDLEAAGHNYVEWRTDEVSWTVNPQATAGDKLRAIGAWVTIGLRNPGEYVKAYGNMTLGWYYPHGSAFYGWHSEGTFNPQYMVQWSGFVQPPATAEQVLGPLRGTDRKSPWRVQAGLLADRLQNYSARNALAYYATWLPLALLAYGLSRRRWRAVGAGVFLGAHVLVLYASPLAFVWYLLPVAFLLPLFAGVNALPAEDAA